MNENDIEEIELKERWKEAIIDCMKELGGKIIVLRDIYSKMLTRSLVTEYHKQPWRPGGQPRYQCWIRRRLTDLTREHKVKKVTRATYSLVK
jgi:hypothetical protein